MVDINLCTMTAWTLNGTLLLLLLLFLLALYNPPLKLLMEHRKKKERKGRGLVGKGEDEF